MLRLVVSCTAALCVASSGCALDFDGIGFTGGGGAGGEGTGAPGSGPSSTSTENTTTGKPGICEGGATCVPAPPTGWIGPGFWLDGDGQCGQAFTVLLSAGETASVGPCPCEPAGPTCTGGVIDYFATSSCLNSVSDNNPFGLPETCSMVGLFETNPPQGADVVGFPMPDPAATCTSPSGFVAKPFLRNPGNLCGLQTAAMCGDGFACTPPGEPACIAVLDSAQTGTCPEPYTQARRVETGPQVCDCSGNPVGSCTGEIELHQDALCSAAVATIPLTIPAECADVSAVNVGELYAKYIPLPATCTNGQGIFTLESWLVCCEP
jgi:hypothetical protein